MLSTLCGSKRSTNHWVGVQDTATHENHTVTHTHVHVHELIMNIDKYCYLANTDDTKNMIFTLLLDD